MANRKPLTLHQALHCAKCKAEANFVEEHHGPNNDFSPDEILVITCPSIHCRERPWFFCRSCNIRCYLNGLDRHGEGRRHKEQHAARYPPVMVPPVLVPVERNVQQTNSPCNEPNDVALTENNATATVALPDSRQLSINVAPQPTVLLESYFPKINLEGNEWLDKAFKTQNIATAEDLFKVFGRPELENQKNFWVADLGSGKGKCGGGVIYLAARAFQQVKDAQLDRNRFPDFEEARWQLYNLIQHHSMNDRQRYRQSRINQTLIQYLPAEKFFKHTFLPPYNQLGKFYGGTGQHSMWNNLPCPVAEDVEGVAYVPLRSIVSFVMANAIPIDDVAITSDTIIADERTDDLRMVHNTDESKKSVDWLRKVKHEYYGSKNGAPDSNSNFGAPKYDTVVCLYLSDWKDGFDTAKVKSNRNSIDTKTFTVSPPKCLVNGTDNTFPVAIGLKRSASGWNKVEAMFRAELEELTTAKEPILFYHGGLQKIVPCFFKHLATLSDKQERNGLTGTLGCGSDTHKCFGVSGKINTPSCDIHKVEEFLQKERRGLAKGEVGWSAEMIAGRPNGAYYPSCNNCRTARLSQLFGAANANQGSNRCNSCRNWDLINPKSSVELDFDAHKSYPQFCTEGSPVAAPKGRDVFQKDKLSLPFIEITWDVMKSACKFAFYQASRPKGSWTKSATTCYLKQCGVSTTLSEQLYGAARACHKAKSQDTINYSRPDGIGEFDFHPAWLSEEIAVKDFIEAVMHQLFLGAAESNYDLIGQWLASTPSGAKLGHNSFLKELQVLIKDLRGFNLSWLLAYPLTGKKGTLGTGSWVAENWIFFVRVSQFVYGWCCRADESSNYGVEDMSRMVIAFHAFVARCLSHSGMNSESITEAELYLKEFLSALREFDIRVRYQKLNKNVDKFSDRKGTEAWWLKPNYMSLSNLVAMMRLIGPLVLWWDGGGKGERFIQLIKPFIKKGVREDALSFFVTLLEKLYRTRQLELFVKRFGLEESDAMTLNKEEEALMDIIYELADAMVPKKSNKDDKEVDEDDDDDNDDEDDDDRSTKTDDRSHRSTKTDDDSESVLHTAVPSDEEEDYQMPTLLPEEVHFSANEVYGMTKTKTIYVYRNAEFLDACIAAIKPIAGIVEVSASGEEKTAFEFFVVYRKPVKQFAKRKVVFDDTQGLFYHGLWCTDILVEDELLPPTSEFKQIQSSAKLSAVALPLWYLIGKNKPNSNKYCVITNWWKYRMHDGSYRLPVLDHNLYSSALDGVDIQSYLAKAQFKGDDDDSGDEMMEVGEL